MMMLNFKKIIKQTLTIASLIFFSTSLLANGIIIPPKGVIELTPRPAPALTLKNLDGEIYDMRQHQNQWRFVHFWASWCVPCRREMPNIETLTKRMANEPLAILLINTAETEDTVFSFLAEVAPDLDSLLDLDGQVAESWQPRGLPSTYLVDPQSNIRYVVIGGRPWHQPVYENFLRLLISTSK